jgi:hypothetical protein
MLETINMFQEFGGNTSCKRKILNTCPMNKLLWFLFQQAIEVIYWILLLILLFIMPGITGIITFVVPMIFSELQKRFNKEKEYLWLTLDSSLCIAMYMILAFLTY